MNKNVFHESFNYPGEKLLRWMSIKGEGTVNEFKQAVRTVAKEFNLEKIIDNDKYFSFNRIMNNFVNLLHIEINESYWNIAETSLNILPGVNNKGVITGSRNEFFLNKLINLSLENDDSFLVYLVENSQKAFLGKNYNYIEDQIKDREDFYSLFSPATILITPIDKKEDFKLLSAALGIHENEVSPVDYATFLPTLDEFIMLHESTPGSVPSIHRPEKFEKFILKTGYIEFSNEENFNQFQGQILEDNYLYRYPLHGYRYKYYIHKNGKNYFLSEEAIGFWKQASRLENRFCFYIDNETIGGILLIPKNLKLPKIYQKALSFCLGVSPKSLRPPRTDNYSNPFMDIYLNIPKEVARILIEDKLNCRLTIINKKNEIERHLGL
jgi:hypothetical protein